MIDMNELETQLRSWVPRRLSPKLERRIFARRAPKTAGAKVSDPTGDQAAGHIATPSFRLSWLAPATLALLLICMLFNQHNIQALSGASEATPMIAVALSNQNVAPWLPGSFAREQNGLPNETFEWTNGSRSTSSISSLSRLRGTN
jgi:hypothetical protein